MPAPIKWTPDFELLNLENPEGEPWLSASPDGRFSLIFFETPPGLPAFTDLEERIYTAAGVEQSAIGTTFSAAAIEHQPSSAYLPDGRRVYVWTEEPVAGGGNLEDVYAEIRFGNNIVDVARFLVTGGAGRQHDPIVAANGTGFAVALADDSVAGGQLILKFYNIAGTPVNTVLAPNAPQTVATGSADQYRDVEIAALANGNYVVVWDSQFNADVFARVYSSGGVAQSGVIDVQTGAPGASFPDVTALADGRFAITYAEFVAGLVRGRIFNADGTPDGLSFAIGSGAANDTDNQVQTAALHDGRFVTVWKTIAGEIAGQVMFANGTPDGAAFTVNTVTAGDQSRPTIATLADGRFAVSWESSAPLIPGTIITTIFDPREQRLSTSASSFADDWVGTSFSDTLFMGTGNDTVHGGDAADFIFGEAGNDTLHGEGSDDRINGGAGIDTLIGGAGNDIYWVNTLSDITTEVAGAGIDTVRSTVDWQLASNVDKLYLDGTAANGTGNALVNFIFGNGQSNILDGQGNADRLYGGAGDDTCIVDSSGDLVFETIAGAAGGLSDHVQSSVNHTLSSNVERLTLTGAGNVNATGNSLVNIIAGNTGNNFIDGKLGSDTLTGNGGADQFLFTTALNAATNTDTITDFDPANDFLRLDDAIFTVLPAGFLAAVAFHTGASAADAGDRIIYNSATGEVFYDSDGLGGVAQVRFANVGIGTALTQADIFVF
ncbi:MAG: calcium-binding protein [Aestuariivirga sp.]